MCISPKIGRCPKNGIMKRTTWSTGLQRNRVWGRHISDDIPVMYAGCMVEKASTEALFEKQPHPYNKGPLSAIPIPNIHVSRENMLMRGKITSPIALVPACRFCNHGLSPREGPMLL